jgi:hypothetical protein
MELWLIIVINFLIGFRPFSCSVYSVAPSDLLSERSRLLKTAATLPNLAAQTASTWAFSYNNLQLLNYFKVFPLFN